MIPLVEETFTVFCILLIKKYLINDTRQTEWNMFILQMSCLDSTQCIAISLILDTFILSLGLLYLADEAVE